MTSFYFQFKQNPYFSNPEIEKEFHLHDDELPSGPTSTAIQWLPGKSLVAKATNGAGSKRKNDEVQVSVVISYFCFGLDILFRPNCLKKGTYKYS